MRVIYNQHSLEVDLSLLRPKPRGTNHQVVLYTAPSQLKPILWSLLRRLSPKRIMDLWLGRYLIRTIRARPLLARIRLLPPRLP